MSASSYSCDDSTIGNDCSTTVKNSRQSIDTVSTSSSNVDTLCSTASTVDTRSTATSTTDTVSTTRSKKLPRRILERQLEILQYEALTEEQQEEYLEYWDKKFKEDLAMNPPPQFVPNPLNSRKHARAEIAVFDFVTEALYRRAYFPKHRRPRRI